MAPPWLKKSPLYRIERARRAALLLAVNALLPAPVPSSRVPRKIAFVKRGGIGDWILFAPVLETIRARFPAPEWELTVYCEQPQTSIVTMIGLCDRIETLDARRVRKSLSHRREVLSQVRSEGYELWFDADIDRTNLGDALSLASAAPFRLGFQADPLSSQSLIEHRVFTTVLPDPINTLHMEERMAGLARALPGEPAASPRESGLRRFRWNGLRADYFAVAPGASTPIRAWPSERFATLCRFIHRETGLRTVLLGGPADQAACSALAERLRSEMPIENLAGKTDLSELFVQIAGARLLVANESGPLHIGHSCATPTLSIVSGADFNNYCSRPASKTSRIVSAPDKSCFNCRWNCIHPLAARNAIRKCLADVTEEAAIAEAKLLIADSARDD